MPAKRKNTKKQAKNNNAKQAKQDGQKAISHEINVPIDEGFKEGKPWPVTSANWQGCWQFITVILNADTPLT